jgi:hypothetical protein
MRGSSDYVLWLNSRHCKQLYCIALKGRLADEWEVIRKEAAVAWSRWGLR